MKHENDLKHRLLSVFTLPIKLFRFLRKFIMEKLEFSIRFRLSLSYLKIFFRAMILGGLAIFLVFGGLKTINSLSQDFNHLNSYLVNELHNDPESFKNIEENPVLKAKIEKYSSERNLPLQIFDLNQELLFSTNPELNKSNYQRFIGLVRTQEAIYLSFNRNRINSFSLTDFVQSLNSPLPAFDFLFYTNISPIIAETIYLGKIIIAVFFIITIFSLFSIFLIGRGFFQPIREMTQTVQDISAKNLNLRLNVSGAKDELKELALTFNEMMNRIEDNYNRQKQFVSDASHELRTPIAVIQGYTNMLDRWGKKDADILQESIDAIKNESENMKELIDKLLFLARHDKGNFDLEKEDFSLTEILEEIAKETQMIDTAHKITFDLKKDTKVYADKNSIKQALRIFIDNALKFTPPGGEINISLDKENDYLAISIKDNGIGMTKEELEHIFDRFYQSEWSRSKEKAGHGLGLAIARIIILGHQGKIKVKSKINAGSEFTILLRETKQNSLL